MEGVTAKHHYLKIRKLRIREDTGRKEYQENRLTDGLG